MTAYMVTQWDLVSLKIRAELKSIEKSDKIDNK